jgi:hypothetical protein
MAKAAPVFRAGDDPEHDLPKTLHSLRPGLPVRIADPRTLRFRELLLEVAPFRGQLQQPLSPVMWALLLHDELLPDQLAENAAQTLLGDVQDGEQLTDGYLRVAADKVDDAVVGAAKTVSRKNRVRLGRKIAVCEKQQLDPIPNLLLGNSVRVGRRIYVRHIDIFRNL